MQLAFGIRFSDLYAREGLLRVDSAFLDFVGEADAALRERLVAEASEHVLSFDWADVARQVAALYRDAAQTAAVFR